MRDARPSRRRPCHRAGGKRVRGCAGGLRLGIVRAVGESAEGAAETALRRVADTLRCFAEAREAASEGGRTPWKRGCGGAGAGACAQGKSPGSGLSGEGVTGMFHVELPCSGVSAREDARCSTQPTATPSPSRRYDRAREVRGWLAVRNHAYGRELWAEDARVACGQESCVREGAMGGGCAGRSLPCRSRAPEVGIGARRMFGAHAIIRGL